MLPPPHAVVNAERMDADTPKAKAGQTWKRRTRHERRTVGEDFEVISAAACPSQGKTESKIAWSAIMPL